MSMRAILSMTLASLAGFAYAGGHEHPSNCLLAIGIESSPAADGEAPPQSNEPAFDLLGNALQKITKEEAEALVVEGKKAMNESNQNPRSSVDAAVAFSKALKYYQSTGDTDTICDLEANIFWCKKRMNIDDVNKYLAMKSDDKYVEAALAVADAVMTKEVKADEAGEYFARAEKFAHRNPKKYDQIAVRYFEVAERFVGTEIGIKAQKLSLVAQQSAMKQMKDSELAARATLFTSPAKISDKIQQAQLPSTEDQKSAMSTLHSLYKEDFSKRKTSQKITFMEKLMEQAASTKDDPVMLYVLLESAIELAVECDEFYTVLVACDHMAYAFQGIEAKEKKKEVLEKSRNVYVRAILKLLDNPQDEESNTIAGKYFCFAAGKWDIGLPLLLNGSDESLKNLADMEKATPSGVAQQIELADKWYDVGKKGRKETKEGPYSRAQFWYQKAISKISGVSKDRILKRMEEIEAVLPMTNLNYDNLTEKQWERLDGKLVAVSAARERTDTGVSLSPGKQYRVVPHPTDTWNAAESSRFRGRGGAGEFAGPWRSSEMSNGSLAMQIGSGKWIKPGIAEGSGRLYLGPYSAFGRGAVGTGVIRCKIIPVDDE